MLLPGRDSVNGVPLVQSFIRAAHPKEAALNVSKLLLGYELESVHTARPVRRVHLPACSEGTVRLPGFSPCLAAGFSSSSPSGPRMNSGLEERRLSSRLSVGSCNKHKQLREALQRTAWFTSTKMGRPVLTNLVLAKRAEALYLRRACSPTYTHPTERCALAVGETFAFI